MTLKLAAWFYHQDHPGPQRGNILVVALEGGDGGFIGCGNRIQSFARLHLVVQNAGLLRSVLIRSFHGSSAAGTLATALRTAFLWSACRPDGRDGGHFAARRNRQMQGQHGPSMQAIAAQPVPAPKHLRRHPEVLRHGLNRISLANLIARDPARISRRIADVLARRDRNNQLGIGRSSAPSR